MVRSSAVSPCMIALKYAAAGIIIRGLLNDKTWSGDRCRGKRASHAPYCNRELARGGLDMDVSISTQEEDTTSVAQSGMAGSIIPASGIRRELLKSPNILERTLPSPPIQLPKFTESAQFGKEIKKKHFFLDDSWAFVNHGAFGAVVKEALQACQSWQTYCEKQPLKFLDRQLIPQLAYALMRLGKFVDSDPNDLVFMPNATTGTNTVVMSCVKNMKPGDSVVTLNTAYGTVQTLLEYVAPQFQLNYYQIDISFPPKSNEEIVETFKKNLRDGTKLAVLDHVPSSHAVILPIKELVDVCHQKGVQVLVDGAHCLGSVNISMKTIGADYYVANGHKWLCTPKGCAFLYVAREHQSTIRPLVVSWGFNYGYSAEFSWIGVRDYSPYLSMITTIDFWEFYGADKMRTYMYGLAREAGALLSNAWGTGLLADPDMFGFMVMVRLPDGVLPVNKSDSQSSKVSKKPSLTDNHAAKMQDILHYDFKVEVPVKYISGQLYVRISAHVYNTLEDYQRLADAVLQIRERSSVTRE